MTKLPTATSAGQPPEGVVVKSHFYRVKKEIIHLSRNIDQLTIKDHQIQIFANILPHTIQKRWALKPLFLAFLQKSIKYWWSFSFHLSFIFEQKTHGFSLFPDGEWLLLQLGLISQDPPATYSHRSARSLKRSSPTSPLTPVWQKQQSKRSKDSHHSWPGQLWPSRVVEQVSDLFQKGSSLFLSIHL